ncbi:MAG: hypothetical protein ACYC9J_13915 [Sulfuricaulis sp.]
MTKRLITIGLEFYYDPAANEIIPPILPDPELHQLVKGFLRKARRVVAGRGLHTSLGCVLFEVPGITGKRTPHHPRKRTSSRKRKRGR